MEYTRFGQQKSVSVPTPDRSRKRRQQSFFNVERPTVAQIQGELEDLTISASVTNPSSDGEKEVLTERVHGWLQGFEGTVESWTHAPATTKEEKQLRQNYTLKLMLALNSNVARVDDTIKKVLYAAMERGGIGRVFEKLRKCLRAVMVEKEIETFEDERDLWL